MRTAVLHPELTAAEIHVLTLFSYGLVADEVGAKRFTSPKTVKTQLMVIRRKLDAKNTTHAVAIGLREGYIK